MTNAEYIARFLQARGVTHVYELIGGMITFLLDALHQHTTIKIVSMHHEQGAAFAAEGWARMKGIPGVAMATSGPGATNLLTGIGSCYFDSVPAVFITGQVNRHEQKGGRAIRQLGFQETDIVAMARPITKGAWLVNQPDELPAILEQAFALASSGRPGPVLVDIPMDVQRSVLAPSVALPDIVAGPILSGADPLRRTSYLEDLAKALAQARRPLALAGGGVRSGRAVEAFRSLVQHIDIPVVNSLMAVDVLPADDSRRVGMIGSYGNRWANLGFGQADLVLVLGSRLDIRQTGSDIDGFRRGRRFFHIDCEPGELNNRVVGCATWVEELKYFLPAAQMLLPAGIARRHVWQAELGEMRRLWPDTRELAAASGINPNEFMHALSAWTPYASAYVSDVGQHQMWAAQSLDLGQNQRFLTSGGMGAMGFALPAAIGAAMATGPVVVIAGDGGFQLNIQELQVIFRNQIPVKIVVLNNGCHGMVRQFQESYFKGRYQSTLWGYNAPNFVRVAEAYGIKGQAVAVPEDLQAALRVFSADPEEPSLLEVAVDVMTNAYPKLAFGRTFGEMEPHAKPLEMEAT
jgi:acetolactate synthase-1/2/3 large subunit